MDELNKNITLQQVKKVPNPTGIGGLAEHPENINCRGRPKNQESISYWYHQFLNMSVDEFKKWEGNNPNCTVAAGLAYSGVLKSRKDLRERKEVTDRTEGKASQYIELEGDIKTRVSNEEVANKLQDILKDNMNPQD